MKAMNVPMLPSRLSTVVTPDDREVVRIMAFAQTAMAYLYQVMLKIGPTLDPPRDDRERCGLMSVVMNVETAQYWAFPVGIVNPAKAQTYLDTALEKARRLRAQLKYGDVSSWQSRDEENGRWGGAIVTESEIREIYSGSALPQLGDEALELLLAIGQRRMGVKRALEIAAISDNPYLKPTLVSMGLIKEETSTEPVAEEPAPATTSDVAPETPAPQAETDTSGEPALEVAGDSPPAQESETVSQGAAS